MCRNIGVLYNFNPPATDQKIEASAIQFVRKISGFTRPSKGVNLPAQRAGHLTAKIKKDRAAEDLLSPHDDIGYTF